jgi:3-hydroxyisobutyrate dehydrogenase-like beta-hydroxyacid dehydrogenase
MSTVSLALVEELQELHRREGISYVAASVFGVPAVAAKAQLNILVAGNAEAVATVQPLLDAMGQKTWHLGDDPKHANVAKIAGNLMITLAIEAMGAATALTESYGLKAVDFLGSSPTPCLRAQATRAMAAISPTTATNHGSS